MSETQQISVATLLRKRMKKTLAAVLSPRPYTDKESTPTSFTTTSEIAIISRMELENLKVPANVWESADFVMANACHVVINESNLATLADKVRLRFAQGFDTVEDAFGSTNDLEKDINLVFFETAANFCFWSQDPNERWKFQYRDALCGGWYGLRNVFANALANGVPMYDATFVSQLTVAQASDLFRDANNRQIPLLEWRVNNMVETAEFLLHEHKGSAYNFIESCDFDAPTIAQEIVRALSSYRDGAWYHGRWIWILKRAQILPNDLSQLSQKYPDFHIRGKEHLTIFADYKLPQVFRHYGVFEYSNTLVNKIDSRQLISNGTSEEIEIRAATLVACKKLSKLCPDITIADIDVSLWLLSQDARDDTEMKPHHMTVSYFY